MSDQKPPVQKTDHWDSGATYNAYVGRWSRLVAREFLNWLNVPPNARWLDVGCGTGGLTETILRWGNPLEVKGVDRSQDYINFARGHIVDSRAQFEVSDAQELTATSAYYDAAVAGLVLNFIPDPSKAVGEMMRVVKPEGIAAVYVWDYADQMRMMRIFWDAVAALHPDALELDEGRRFPLCRPEPLLALFQHSGLGEVKVRSIDITTHFQNFEDYWTPFLGGQGPAPSYVKALDEPERVELRDYIYKSLPFNADGSIDLVARAWAVSGFTTTAPS